MICPACGHENISGSAICDNCNIDLTQFEEPNLVTKSMIERAICKDKLAKIGKENSVALIVSPEKTVKEVIDLMLKNNKFSAVVMEGSSINGIFTERSLLKRVCNEFPIDISKPVSEAMLIKPEVLKPDNTVVDALHMMEVGGYTYAIVQNTPLRVLNIRDILEYIIELDL
ncbi:MAG: CBS domain-containing protein [Candidatus Hodarchaeales archaeon]|jgi:predicted transcriptional regulator